MWVGGQSYTPAGLTPEKKPGTQISDTRAGSYYTRSVFRSTGSCLPAK